MGVKRVMVSGQVSSDGPNMSGTATSKPQTSLTLVRRESGKDGDTYKTFIPVLMVGPQAEPLTEQIAPWHAVVLEGTWAKGRISGTWLVPCFAVEQVGERTAAWRDDQTLGSPPSAKMDGEPFRLHVSSLRQRLRNSGMMVGCRTSRSVAWLCVATMELHCGRSGEQTQSSRP